MSTTVTVLRLNFTSRLVSRLSRLEAKLAPLCVNDLLKWEIDIIEAVK